MILDKLSEILTNIANKLGYQEQLRVIKSNRPDLCDFQCDEIFKLTKIYHKSPIEIGEEIVKEINQINDFNDYFEKVEFCKPGFINITISNKFISDNLKLMGTKEKFNLKHPEKVETYVIDYGGPNIAKPLHVGHMRPAIVGESIKRIIDFAGHKTISDVHLGDIGLPIGEVIYACLRDGKKVEDIDLPYLNKVYPEMSKLIKEDEAVKEECASIIKEVQDKTNYLDYWKKICEVSNKDIKRLYKYLDVSFDYWLSESDAYAYLPKVKDYLIKKDLLKDSDGAKVVFVNRDDDKITYPPLIFQKSNGGYLYESSDLGTIYQRMEDFNPDYILYVTDQRQAMHFEKIFRVCQISGLTKDTKLVHLPHGTINGLDGKPYKTRQGNTPKLDELFNEVKEIFISKKEENKNMSEDDINKIVNSILKFADLQNGRDRDYIFDINKFSDTQGKTGPYILYSYLRMNKIIEKYTSNINNLSDKVYNIYDRKLRMNILNLDECIMMALKEYKPNYIAEYIYELCVAMNAFYQNNHIANLTDDEQLNDWISIIKLANNIIKEMLHLLIIEIPSVM
ncbi:MAG: arginine--tRNA ligase [Bacilli bacterium]|nr:arginine--tRNA ligase [Bacilli bacterium]